jgi:hypothetical protein
MGATDSSALVAAILNDWWMVRHYGLARNPAMRLQRAQAILKLGLTVRHAFNSSDDFEVLLAAVIQGGSPRDDRPPF